MQSLDALTVPGVHVRLIDCHAWDHILIRRTAVVLVLLILFLLPGVDAIAQVPGFAEIVSPNGGEAIQGLHTILGSATHPLFHSYQLSFSYLEDDTQTWFLIGEPQNNPILDGGLGLWDTTGISDGNYRLKLDVYLDNETSLVAIVEGIRIRNSSAIEDPTAAPIHSQITATSAPPTSTPRPTPLPPISNDGTRSVSRALVSGVLIGIVFLLGSAVYLSIRRYARQRFGMLRMRQILREQDRRKRRRQD